MNPWETYQTYDKPLFRVGQLPVYVTTLMVALKVMSLTAIAVLGYGAPVVSLFIYSAPAVLHEGKLWTLLTYAFVDYLDFWVALGLVMFYIFGRWVEMRLGPQRYLLLLGSLILAPTLLLTLIYPIFGDIFGQPLVPTMVVSWLIGPSAYWSLDNVDLAMLVAFVWLHPEALFWRSIPAKWIGVFFVAVQTLQFLGVRMWVFFWMCWFSLFCAYVILRRMGLLEQKFPAIEGPILRGLPKRKPKGYRSSKRNLKVVKITGKGQAKRVVKYESKLAPKLTVHESSQPAASVDHLLEKISRHGIASLTEKERKQLENASSQLSDKDEASS